MINEREGGLELARWLSESLAGGVGAVARGERLTPGTRSRLADARDVTILPIVSRLPG